MEKRRFKAKIGAKDYIIVGPGSEQHMSTVTRYLNEQLTQIKRLSPGITDEEAAILLAFNTTSDILNEHDAKEESTEPFQTEEKPVDAHEKTKQADGVNLFDAKEPTSGDQNERTKDLDDSSPDA